MKNVKSKCRIAITGIIGSGKSTVSKIFEQHGYDIFSADQCNSELLLNNPIVFKEISQQFSSAIVDNKINKAILSDIIFNDEKQKAILNRIMHPLILEQMLLFCDNHKIAVCEIPLLYETKQEQYFDIVIVVASDMDIIIKRLSNKGLSISKINQIINSQISLDTKIEKADVIFYNNNTSQDLYGDVSQWIKGNLNGSKY